METLSFKGGEDRVREKIEKRQSAYDQDFINMCKEGSSEAPEGLDRLVNFTRTYSIVLDENPALVREEGEALLKKHFS